MANRIPLDPKLPKDFDSTPNEARSKEQLDAWWDHPFGVTRSDGRIEVRCLNGGAWDRSTGFGVADDYDAACSLAEAKQADWLKFRERPTVMIDDGQVLVTRMPQRPDQEFVVLATLGSTEEASAFLQANYPDNK